MAAIEVIQSNLIAQSRAPYTNTTGGTSVGNPNAGASSIQNPAAITPSTTGDKAGAAILTTFVLVGLVGGLLWMSM